jgi:hypothetical protein
MKNNPLSFFIISSVFVLVISVICFYRYILIQDFDVYRDGDIVPSVSDLISNIF